MEDTPFIEELTEEGFSRRELLKRGAVAGVGVTALAGLSIETAGARSGADGRHRPLGHASRLARGDGRLQPAHPHEAGVLQAARDQREAVRRRRNGQPAADRSGSAGHGLRLAGRPDRSDRRRRPGHLDLVADPRASVRLRAARGQQDHAPAPAEGEDDLHPQRRLDSDRQPDVGGGRSRPEDRQVPRVRPAMEPGGCTQAGRRRAVVGRAPGSAQRHECDLRRGVQLQVPHR